ncbi:MAG: hypothetical protein NTW28_02465 [Candidatus Solibacter sp.]|nr:hypothetical protein [Candidatus Solibacter sp.]
MPLQILPYAPEAVPAVREFNQRLLAGGAAGDQRFPETPDPGWMPGMELFLALEESRVRGGYILRRQVFSVDATAVPAAHYRLPLSEGVVNRAYAMLGLRMVRDALSREPRLYALGMGGWDKPLPQMLKRLGFAMCAVPFHFKVVHPARFLRNIRALRTSPLRSAALDAAAFTGAGWLGMKALGLATPSARRLPPVPVDLAPAFAPWADEVWDRLRPAYALLAQRDAATLDQLYPPSDPRFLRVRAAGGWAVLLDTQMRNHKQFGDMRVGAIVDCLAPTESAVSVVRAAASLLEQRGVDMIVSNQLHSAWSRALLECGFRHGPSNYLLALSPAFAQAAGGASRHQFHINRGDGDGPIHL